MPELETMRRVAGRAALSRGLWPLFPYEAKGQHEPLMNIESALQNNIGIVIALPHFSNGDFQRVLFWLANNVPTLRSREILIPVAQHQIDKLEMKFILGTGDIQGCAVTTTDTKQKEQELMAANMPIPWEVRPLGSGVFEYARKSAGVLSRGGLVAASLQAGRRSQLDPFEGNPLELLDRVTRRVENVAYVFTGLSLPGDDYTRDGMNPLTKYGISISNPIPRQELHEWALQNEWTLDDTAYNILFNFAPEAYRPGIVEEQL